MIETRTAYTTQAQERTGLDPACRFSSFCWSTLRCENCEYHSRLIDDRELSANMLFRPDPTCIHAPECETKDLGADVAIAYGCNGCGDYEHVTKATAPETAEAELIELPDPKQVYLDCIGVTDLRNRANDLLRQVADARGALSGTEARLRDVAQAEDMAEAHLILCEQFAQLKNETARKAWLTLQRGEDAEYATAIAAKRRAQEDLELRRVALDVLVEQLRVVLAEMRLVSSQLMFMAGER